MSAAAPAPPPESPSLTSDVSLLTSDCFDAILACLDCYSLALAQCVCQHWRKAAAADSLWKTQVALEFGLTALPPGFPSFKALFQECQASPTLAPLRCEARLASIVSSIQSWSVRIEQYARAQPPGATPFGRGAVPAAGPASAKQRAQQQGQGAGEAESSRSLPSEEHGGRDVPLVCELMTCQHFIQNRQSVWVKFGLPQWIQEGEEDEEDEPDLLQGGNARGSASGNAASAVGQRGQGQQEAAWNLLVVEAVHDSGHVLEVIRSEGFKMPQSDLEMLMQSHTEGLYAWEADAPPPAPETEFHQALELAANSGQAIPPGTLERHGMQQRAQKLSKTLSVVAYVHYEQLLPLVGLADLPVPQSLHLPPMPLWTLQPGALALQGQQQRPGAQGEGRHGRAAAAGGPGAVTSSSQREPAAYLHADWCQLVTSGRRGSAWVALYPQWHESCFHMMGVELTEQDVVLIPGSAALVELPGNPSLADCLVCGRPPGCASMTLTHQQHAVGSTGAAQQQEAAQGLFGSAQHQDAPAASAPEEVVREGVSTTPAGPGCSVAAAQQGLLSCTAQPAGGTWAAAVDLLDDALSGLTLEPRTAPTTSPGTAEPAPIASNPAAGNLGPCASTTGPSASSSPTPASGWFPAVAPPWSAAPGAQPRDASLPWSSLRLASNLQSTCSTLAELCAADGMVDFSLWSSEGRLLLGRSGVELWSRSNETVNYCCHFLVDGIADPTFRQSLWENTLWVRPEAGAGGAGGAAFALSLTFQAARALFGEVADDWH